VRILKILIFFLFVSIAQAQIKKSIEVKIPLDTMSIVQDMDEYSITHFGSPRNQRPKDSLQTDTIIKPLKLYIERSMLDSLLKPYYNIQIDTNYEESNKSRIIITPKYRMVVDGRTSDTSYVAIPKSIDYFDQIKTLGIDTIGFSNAIELTSIKRIKKAQDPVWWDHQNSIGFDFNEVAFLNWNAGGSNSISGLFKMQFKRIYEKLYTLWNNEVSARYGLNQQEDKGLIKTDDEIKLSSTFGYRKDTISNWYFSAQFNFRTQFTDGYKNPDDEDIISSFFAPAYLFLGVGAQYNLKPKLFSVYISPLTLKTTYVFNDQLSEEGAFGVVPGENSRHEIGILVEAKYEKEIFKNVAMVNNLGLYTDYINKFGNIDVDWTLSFQFKINKLFQANFRSHLIYDDDIKTKITNDDGVVEIQGAKVQLKQQLGIGVIYNF
jgi:hypothetical protein